MTPFNRGDVILLSYPTSDSLEMHLRPAMVLHSVHERDAGVAVAPIAMEPSETYASVHVALGSYEAARFGLLASGYLTACGEIVVDRQFVVKKLGQCPWQLLNEFLEMNREPIIKPHKTSEAESASPNKHLVREAV